MPATTRYSATFDRTYEEDDRPEPPAGRRSRSLSLQANSPLYSPAGSRSSSTDNGPAKVSEGFIPTRSTAKAAVKSHNNPFQFVKVGTCPLYRKAEEQLKKTKEVKKPEVLKEEEEEWQTNLDSWKSRRRKMSEDVFRRQEEIKQFEMEEQVQQCNQRKIKTFSEMVESRAHRGRALSMCLLASPLELQSWETEERTSKSCSNSNYSGGSEENSAVNSEDEGVIFKGLCAKSNESFFPSTSKVSSPCEALKSTTVQSNGSSRSPFVDSGLESISSSNRAGDSGSDFSQDSGSSLDCDSPRISVNGSSLFTNGKTDQKPPGAEITVKLELSSKSDVLGFTFVESKEDGQPVVTSLLEGSLAQISGFQLGDKILFINGSSTHFKKLSEIDAILQKAREKQSIEILLWRKDKSSSESSYLHQNGTSSNGYLSDEKVDCKDSIENNMCQKFLDSDSPMISPKLVLEATERSIESENEMYVDDFEELATSEFNMQPCNSSTPVINQASCIQRTNVPTYDSLNIIYESHPVNTADIANKCQKNVENAVIVSDKVVPVEKVAEEMEKLILEQLEEEERAKELSIEETKGDDGSSEHLLLAPTRTAEPPKEKPPPPPVCASDVQKPTSLKRVNSTKRIKKEIHKRRSNFLGIENADENTVCDDAFVAPPLALEEILKAEMELDRESRRKLESATTERLTLEEQEMMLKEQQIIDSLESEERRKLLLGNTTDVSSDVSALNCDELLILQEEMKELEEARLVAQQTCSESNPLHEREEYIKKQEDISSEASLTSLPASSSSKSVDNISGDGKSVLSAPPSGEISNQTKVASSKPVPPPKPLKKKEALRKERERLRQEQEALQREREEHRRQLAEQEELLRSQKSHGTFHPPIDPQSCAPLTILPIHARETFASRSHHGAQVGNNLCAELEIQPTSRPSKAPACRAVRNETWGQKKISSVKKQNQDSLAESRYNQNHWLIQEAEMRRIAEQQERQRASDTQTYPPDTSDVCSKRMLNYAVPDVWNYSSQQSSEAPVVFSRKNLSPSKPSKQEQHMLSVSGRKRCSHCADELAGRGAAMIIESLHLYYHLNCFKCCVCHAQLGNGSCGTDVRVRNNKLHCHNCYSNDEAGLKFSQV